MDNPWKVYELMQDSVPAAVGVEVVCLGREWTLCRAQGRIGLAASPAAGTGLGAGDYSGRPACELASWLREWDPYRSSIGQAVVNATLSCDAQLLARRQPLAAPAQGPAELGVFEHFRPHLLGRRVVVVGRYPGLAEALPGLDLRVLADSGGDLPLAAAEFLIPQADWVFLSAATLADKTFPRLAGLAQGRNLVLLGPATPWLSELNEFGVDYLVGVRVDDLAAVERAVVTGSDPFASGAGMQYCIADLGACELDWIKTAIADTVARREWVKQEMERWLGRAQRGRFPLRDELMALDERLSSLDTRFKRLWDARH